MARTGTCTANPTPPNRASKLTKSLPSFSIWVAEKLTLSTILPSFTYWRGTVTPSAAASTTMCGVSPLSEIHSCKRTQQVRTPRLQWRISRSASVKQARNVERAKMAFMYFMMGCACAGSSMP